MCKNISTRVEHPASHLGVAEHVTIFWTRLARRLIHWPSLGIPMHEVLQNLGLRILCDRLCRRHVNTIRSLTLYATEPVLIEARLLVSFNGGFCRLG